MPDITTPEQYGKTNNNYIDPEINSKSIIGWLDETMQQSELQALGQHIQVKLQQLPSPIRLRVRCAFREEALLVLAEHLLHVEPSPRQIFSTVAEALQENTLELMKSGLVRSGVGGTKFLPVRIYLRVAGYQQPYDSFVFSLKPSTPPPSIIPLPVPPAVAVTPPEPPEPPEPAILPILEPESIGAPPVAEVESATEIEPVAEQFEPLADPIAESTPSIESAIEPEIIEVLPVAQVEPVASGQEPSDFSDQQIVELIPAVETQDLQTDRVLDGAIAEVSPVEIAELEIVTSEVAINELVFAESIDFEQLLTLEEPLLENITELPIAEEKFAESPTSDPEDLPIDAEAIADPLLAEEASAVLEHITSSQEATGVPAAIAPADNIPIVDSINLAANEIQDAPEPASTPAEPVEIEPSPAPTFLPSILSAPISRIEPQLTTPDRLLESLGLRDADIVGAAGSTSLADVEVGERADEPETAEVFDGIELDTALPQSVLAPDLKETPEPKSLTTNYILPSEEIVVADAAIAEKFLTDELYPHVNAPPPQNATLPLAPNDPATQPASQSSRAPQFSSSSIMLGTAIALFGLLGGWYILSRPCVLGSSCEPLQEAQQISQAAFQTVQTTESAIAIAKAYDDLGTANKLLKSIPTWSGQHQAAQTLLADNDAKSTVIGQLVRTLRQGNEAAKRSQNPPHPLPEWREIQRLWRESIVALERIPSNTAIYPVAQRKITEYRTNLEGINKRVVVEQQAQEEVENAKKTAQLAETRTGIATSAEGWREVYASWQAAIDFLKNVPNGAAARLEAEELLKIYQTKLAAAGSRRDQENIAIAAYTEAIAQADQAQSFQQKNQWQNAIAAWEGAVATVQKVAQGTTPYAQAQPLIATYQTALAQAQSGLQVSEAIQAAKPALDRTCSGSPKVCQYDAAPTAIRVQITYGYDQMVETAMISAQTQGNSAAQAGVVSQVNTFLQELALISQTAQVPIDLYNANGSKFGTYSPNASGFIPQ